MLCARVRDEAGRRGHVRRFTVQLRHPHDEGHETRIWLFGEQDLLDFGSPPKALPSRWRDEHHDSHLTDVCVERASEWRGRRSELSKRCWCRLRHTAAREEEGCSDRHLPDASHRSASHNAAAITHATLAIVRLTRIQRPTRTEHAAAPTLLLRLARQYPAAIKMAERARSGPR